MLVVVPSFLKSNLNTSDWLSSHPSTIDNANNYDSFFMSIAPSHGRQSSDFVQLFRQGLPPIHIIHNRTDNSVVDPLAGLAFTRLGQSSSTTRDSKDGLAADTIRLGFVEIDLWETVYPSALVPHLLLYTCR